MYTYIVINLEARPANSWSSRRTRRLPTAEVAINDNNNDNDNINDNDNNNNNDNMNNMNNNNNTGVIETVSRSYRDYRSYKY